MSQGQGPYQSPQAYGMGGYPPGHPAPRSGAVTAAAIIDWVYGGLQFLGGLCGTIFFVFVIANAQVYEQMMDELRNNPDFQNEPEMQEMMEFFREHVAVFTAQFIISLAVGVLAIVGGIGVIKRRQWGRMMSFAAAILEVVNIGISIWMNVKLNSPMGFLGVALAAGYVISIFILLNTAAARAEFLGASSANPYQHFGGGTPGGPGQPPYNR